MSRFYDALSRPAVRELKSGAYRHWWPVAVLPLALLWSYWSTVSDLVHAWQSDDNYSVGQLVPLLALYLLWHERHALMACKMTPCWWGAGLLLLAQGARAFGLLYMYDSAERYSLVITIAGIVMLVAGRQVFRQVQWILLFLFLMVPLPGRVHELVSGSLQAFATRGAVFTLELFGVTVGREGNIMVLNDNVRVAVAEACSGLRMLTAFVVVASTLAYVVKRPVWQKTLLILSSIPVAIVCNIARLVITSALIMTVSSATAERFFHDFAGLTMMPLAIFILVFELWIMRQLVMELPSEITS